MDKDKGGVIFPEGFQWSQIFSKSTPIKPHKLAKYLKRHRKHPGHGKKCIQIPCMPWMWIGSKGDIKANFWNR